jgi:hypothetical protein
VRQVQQNYYKDTGANGRKIDLLFRDGDFELANFEFKLGMPGCAKFRMQLSLNIRINRAIMEWNKHNTGQRMHIFFMTFEGI